MDSNRESQWITMNDNDQMELLSNEQIRLTRIHWIPLYPYHPYLKHNVVILYHTQHINSAILNQ